MTTTSVTNGVTSTDLDITNGNSVDVLLGGTIDAATIFSGGFATIEVGGGGDIFRGTTADLTGSTIRDFLPSDSIDLINVAEAHARVSYNAGTSGVSVTDGYHTAAITLAGSCRAGGFSLASDGNGGTSVLYHAT
jgi:hypothetical protein